MPGCLHKPNQQDWLSILRRAAKAGRGAILANYDASSRRKVVRRGAGGDLTLRIDEVSEKAIFNSLRRDLGEDSFVFVSEELGETAVNGDEPRPIVICDPLDGSHNAQVGIPLSSLSLAVLGVRSQIRPSQKRRFGDVDVALVQSIMTDDEYVALKEKGAYHNGKQMKASSSKESQRIETLGIECSDIDYIKELIVRLTKKRVNKLRVLGSVAVSLSLLAEGALDGLIFAQPGGARSIDSAAGYLIAKEAGCIFSDLARKAKEIDSVEVGFNSGVNMLGARTVQIHRELVRLVGEP
jgi:fructose-1,6-bisphosphatase/inositol monophosphatase family enzyme